MRDIISRGQLMLGTFGCVIQDLLFLTDKNEIEYRCSTVARDQWHTGRHTLSLLDLKQCMRYALSQRVYHTYLSAAEGTVLHARETLHYCYHQWPTAQFRHLRFLIVRCVVHHRVTNLLTRNVETNAVHSLTALSPNA